MTGSLLASMASAGTLAWVVAGTGSRRRLPAVVSMPGAGSRPPSVAKPSVRGPAGLVVPALSGALVWLTVGGAPGAAAAAVVAAGLAVRGVRRSAAVARAEQQAPVRGLATAVGLLAGCLESGAPPVVALARVADVAPDEVAHAWAPVVGELLLGADPARAWAPALARGGELAALARVMVRSAATGAAAAAALRHLVDDLARERRARAAAAAESVAVRIVVPLGLCFLPAFVLVGVVPAVWGLVAPLLAGP
jgi:pilus assembly protein TadC